MIERRAAAERIAAKFAASAAAIGAMPVPAASLAIIAIDAAMLASINEAIGARASMAAISASIGVAGAANAIGRAVFLEAARAIGWFAGPLGIAGVSALGAATAGLQTWTLGQVAIAVCMNGGAPLTLDRAGDVIAEARSSYRGAQAR